MCYTCNGDIMSILDIFYNEIIPECSKGRVECFFYYNVLFNTIILESNKKYMFDNSYDGLMAPTLIIKDKEKFDTLLEQYVRLCLDFYDESNYPEEINNDKGYLKEKMIMTLLFSNATYEDFNNPIEFLQKRIAFLEGEEKDYECSFSPSLDGVVSISIEKDKIYNETPYKFSSKVINEEGNTFSFPEIKFGIYNDTVYVYAIQNKGNEKNDYSKKVNRTLFKIGEGFDIKEDNYELYEEGNLKDISASFLVSLNMFISYIHNLGYDKIVVPSILICRYNAKKIALYNALLNNRVTLDTQEFILNRDENIQKNLTEKFIRTFLRLKHHYSNINITSMPYETDSSLHLLVSNNLSSNNHLLNETSKVVTSSCDRKLC